MVDIVQFPDREDTAQDVAARALCDSPRMLIAIAVDEDGTIVVDHNYASVDEALGVMQRAVTQYALFGELD